MIPVDYIAEWRQYAAWIESSQVEQDLIISRALVEMFRRDEVIGTLAFRGGSALYRLHLLPAARYSEDIDLVQLIPGPIGKTIDALRDALDPWLGKPKRTFKKGRVILTYRMQSEDSPPLPMRMKIEINTDEHFTVLDLERRNYEIRSRWFSGGAPIQTYQLDELLGTKLRALYQRKKGRDLFDLWLANQRATVDPDRLVHCFRRHLDHEGHRVTRAEFEANLSAKLDDPDFVADINPLLTPGTDWNLDRAYRYVRGELLPRLAGERSKGAADE